MNLATIERRVASLAARLQPPPAPPSRLELAERLGLTLGAWQRDAALSEHPRLLLNCSRQSGKSTVAALLGVHEAISRPGALVLAVSPGERQSKLLFRTMLGFYRDLDHPVPTQVENKLSLELANGSQVHALPGSGGTVRGFSGVSLLLIDEASRVPDELRDAVSPMLAVSGGRLVALSTPAGRRGWWWEAWTSGGDDWQRYEVRAEDVPRIPAAFLAAERRSLPQHVFASEYECAFVEDNASVFRYADVDNMLDDAVRPLFAATGD